MVELSPASTSISRSAFRGRCELLDCGRFGASERVRGLRRVLTSLGKESSVDSRTAHQTVATFTA